MPYFEVHLFKPGSNQPFASLPRSTTSLGSFGVGESIAIGSGASLVVGKVAYRCLPGPDRELVVQTALFISGLASLVHETLAEPWLVPGGDFVPWPVLSTPEARVGALDGSVFEGVGSTLEEAAKFAHAQIPLGPHRDFTVSKVVGWGVQLGGIANQTRFYVQVVEDPDASFRSDMPPRQQIQLWSGYIVGNG